VIHQPARCHRTRVSGLMIVMTFQDREKLSIQLAKEDAVAIRQPDSSAPPDVAAQSADIGAPRYRLQVGSAT